MGKEIVVRLTEDMASEMCRGFCKYYVIYGWDKRKPITGIERVCENCPLLKGAKHVKEL